MFLSVSQTIHVYLTKMMRRNIYTICVLFGVSVLLIIDIKVRYTGNTCLMSIESQKNAKIIVKLKNGEEIFTQEIPIILNDDTHVSIEMENVPEMTNENLFFSSPDITNKHTFLQNETHSFSNITNLILEKSRLKIKYDTYNYNFSQSGVHELEDLVMESGGQPLINLVVSTWRSGSTFTADLINNARPSTYFHNEPLFMYGTKQFRTPKEGIEPLSVVKRMLKCNYTGLENYFEYERKHFREGSPSTRLWKYCKYDNNDELCFNAEVTSKLCKLFPFQNVKLERLRLQLVEAILNDKTLNAKVILLIRDPRGVMNSRRQRTFCRLSSDCWEPSMLCADMVSDYMAAGRILKHYPDKIMVVRFEELALQPNITSDRILNFLKAQRTQAFDDFLQSHTNVELCGAYSTSKVSRNIPFKWKTALDFEYVTMLQKECRLAMRIWGYKMAHNETHMTSKDFNPVDDYTI